MLRSGEGAGAKAKALGSNGPRLKVMRRPGIKDGGLGDPCGQQGGGGGGGGFGKASARSRKEPLWRKPAAKAHEAKAVETEKARDAPGNLCLYRNIHEDMP
jgi:hypothetical protein